MAVVIDYTLAVSEDGTLTISLAAPTAVGGWNVLFTQSNRQGGVAFRTKSAGPGFGNGVSGVTVQNSGQGIWNIALYGAEMSGKSPGNYYFLFQRTDSGFVTDLTTGYQVADQ